MSRVMTLDGNQVQFVLNDTEELSTESLSDIIYSDGTRAILVNGGQILQGDTQTVVLQEDEFNQYYINDESADILVADEQDTPIIQTLDDAEVVQYIEEDGNVTMPPQVIYVNEEGYAIDDADLSQYQILEDEDNQGELSHETVKFEQVVDLEELLRQQGDETTAVMDDTEANGYQYAILKDGKLHIQSFDGDAFPASEPDVLPEREDVQERDVDLSKITGRNLLTGQTVSLHSYMDKLQRKIKEGRTTGQKRRTGGTSTGLRALLNKKLTLGKTTNGKRLVGKVIHVEKKNEGTVEVPSTEDVDLSQPGPVQGHQNTLEFDDTELAPLPEPADPPQPDKRKVLIQEKLVSAECFGHIRRTLGGLMIMDTVKKKLQHKNVVVKVVERRHDRATGGYARKVSYGCGRMQEEFLVDEAGDVVENWSFVLDENAGASILGEDGDGTDSRYPETTNVTVVVTYEADGTRAVRVILNPSGAIRCAECGREFATDLQLRVHALERHPTGDGQRAGGRVGTCEACGLRFSGRAELREHREKHVEEGKLFACPETGCGRFFLTARRLKRHGASHAMEQVKLECAICSRRCSNESGLKRHMATAHPKMRNFPCETCGDVFANPGELNFHRRAHGTRKYYACQICKRSFSRHSNLQRHLEIHKGSEELYQCTICGCSYHYMSSLTRHVVQNHIRRADAEAPHALVEDDAEA